MTEARTGCARPRAGARWRLIALSTVLSMMLAACSSANIPKIADAPPTPQPEKQTLLTASEQREHLRILAAYGGVYREPRVQQMLEKTVDKLVACLRAAGAEIRGHHPQLARGQRLRAAERPALRHPRPRRACQRQLRARLGAGARDGACDRPPRRDPRGPGAPGRAGQPRRDRPAQRSAARRAGARQVEDHARQLLARPGVRGRRHRRRHLGARRLRPLRRRALPHLDGHELASARAARQHRSARAGLPVVASGDAGARHQRRRQRAAVHEPGRRPARPQRISRR